MNYTVVHKTYGEGTVTAQTDGYITVRFSEKEATFEYVKAFPDFLRCADPQQQADVEADIAEKMEIKRKQAEADAQAARRAAEEAAKTSAKHSTAHTRKSSDNNLAFKCNFCDGGCGENCIGYKGVCSDGQIRCNIEVKHHSWCSNSGSACSKYLNGEITREELDAQNASGNFVCYESRMLTAWTAAAGEDLNETGTQQGRRIQDASSDSLAVLTTRSPEAEEDERVIFAVFITGQAVEGNELFAGYVVAKDDYKIELTPEEAKKMQFWHYYKNTDGGIRWSQGLYRYLKDTAAARILADIVELKTGSDKEHAQKVLAHYCELKGIDANKIPAANGAK